MDKIEFQDYLQNFEHYIIKVGIELGVLGKEVWCPIRDGRLTGMPIAALVGTRFSFARPAVIEYFGLHKRSTGFMEKAQRLQDFCKGFPATVVNLSAVKDNHIAQLRPGLLVRFPAFKEAIIKVRFANEKTPEA